MTEATTLKSQLMQAMKDAMKAQDKGALATIRLMQAALKQIEIDEGITIDDTRALAVLDKMAKQRCESIEQYQQAQRDDLVAQEQAELAVIKRFMPEPLSEDAVAQIVRDAIEAVQAQSIKDMAKVMEIVRPQVMGRAEMAMVSDLIKRSLTA